MKAIPCALALMLLVAPVQSFSQTEYLTQNDIEYCEENYEQYKLIGEYQFLERERRTIESRVCVHLYEDPVWDYTGVSRDARLLERGNYYVDAEIAKSKANADTGIVPQEEKPVTDLQKAGAKILELEKEVAALEKKIAQKDAIIAAQVKVLLDLASKIKSILFEIPGVVYRAA